MIYTNNPQLRAWLEADHSKSLAALDRFKFDDMDFKAESAKVAAAHHDMREEQIAIRAAYHLLMTGQHDKPVADLAAPTRKEQLAARLERLRFDADFWFWARAAWGVLVALLLLICAARGHAQSVQVIFNNGSATVPTSTANPLPVTCISGCSGGGGGGGTSSNFGATFPTAGTAAGASDGVNMQPLLVDGSGNLKTFLENSTLAVTQSGTWTFSFTAPQHVILDSGTLTSITNPVAVTGTFFQVTQPVSCTSANCAINNAQVNGVTTSVGAGAAGTGTQRVGVAQDATTIAGSAPGTAGSASSNVVTVQGVASMTKLLVTPDANSAVNVAQVAGTTTDTNSGNKSAGTQRIVIATDQPAIAGMGEGATGSAVPASANYIGGNGSGNLTGIISCDNSSAVNMSTATTTQIVAISGSGGRTYICAIDLVTNAANNVALISGSGSNCASNQAGLAGGVTAASGWNFTTNGGIAAGSGLGMLFKSVTTNNEICLVTSAATQLSGSISWTQF